MGCLLDYNHVKYNYRLIAVDLSRHRQLNAALKRIQPIKFAGQLKDTDGINPNGT